MNPSQWIQDLSSADAETRLKAAQALSKDPAAVADAVIPLCRTVSDPDEQVREWSQACLEELGPPPKEELEALVELTEAEELTAYWAATLLGRLEQQAAAAAPALAAVVASATTPDEVRNRAIWALGRIGTTSSEVRAVLEEASTSENPRTARLARKALGGR